MTPDAVIVMLLLLGGVWGGFAVMLLRALRKARSEEAGGS